MIIEKYEYKYVLIPREVARQLGIGWRKTTAAGMVMLNLSEAKALPGDGTFEERVAAAGGQIMEPEQARYLVKTTNMSLDKKNPSTEETIPPVETTPPAETPAEGDPENNESDKQIDNNLNLSENE